MTPQAIQVVFRELRERSSGYGHRYELMACRAYNDMLYLCEKYAPLESLERYRPENDISVTGAYIEHENTMMSRLHHTAKA
jgi:hypothetical protein